MLDDAHRAGREVAEFAEHLLRRPPDAPVLTVLVHRGSGQGAGLASLAHPDGAVRHIPLRPLPRAAAAALLPAGLAPLHRELILRDAAGVPGLLRALSDGEPPDTGGVPHSSLELACGPSPLAPSVQALDLGALSPLARRAAAAAAAAGDPFTVETVAHTAPLSVAEALRAVDELHSEGIVGPDRRAGWFRFRRPAARALLHQAAGAAQRRAARERALAAPAMGEDTGAAVPALLETTAPPTAAEADLLEKYARTTVFTQLGPRRAGRPPGGGTSRRPARRVAAAVPGPGAVRAAAQALTEYARRWPRQEAGRPPPAPRSGPGPPCGPRPRCGGPGRCGCWGPARRRDVCCGRCPPRTVPPSRRRRPNWPRCCWSRGSRHGRPRSAPPAARCAARRRATWPRTAMRWRCSPPRTRRGGRPRRPGRRPGRPDRCCPGSAGRGRRRSWRRGAGWARPWRTATADGPGGVSSSVSTSPCTTGRGIYSAPSRWGWHGPAWIPGT
ncbi:hypothetical protein ACFQ51_50705 [Streptomyces kaempferi]